MRIRDAVFGLGGLGAGVALAVVGRFAPAEATPDAGAPAASEPEPPAEPRPDPALAANERLADSLRECSERLARLSDENSLLGQEVAGERATVADAGRAAAARRYARRNPSPNDWKELARSGTVRYTLPCAAFGPSPETMKRLGLAPREIPVVRDAFQGARTGAWLQIRPLCIAAVGSARDADIQGLDLCPKAIFDSAVAADAGAVDDGLRAVGAVRAGLADPSSIASGDAVGTTFLVLTGVAKDAEARIASDLGPEDARAVVFGNNGCSQTSEFSSPTAKTSP